MRWWALLAPAFLAAGLVGMPMPAHDKVRLENTLDACLTVTAANAASYANLLILRAKLQSRRPTGACGCKSALLAYRVTEGTIGDEPSTGRFLDPAAAKPDSPFFFVLKSDHRARSLDVLTVHIGCGPP